MRDERVLEALRALQHQFSRLLLLECKPVGDKTTVAVFGIVRRQHLKAATFSDRIIHKRVFFIVASAEIARIRQAKTLSIQTA